MTTLILFSSNDADNLSSMIFQLMAAITSPNNASALKIFHAKIHSDLFENNTDIQALTQHSIMV